MEIKCLRNWRIRYLVNFFFADPRSVVQELRLSVRLHQGAFPPLYFPVIADALRGFTKHNAILNGESLGSGDVVVSHRPNNKTKIYLCSY
jgi:hypothetical protein